MRQKKQKSYLAKSVLVAYEGQVAKVAHHLIVGDWGFGKLHCDFPSVHVVRLSAQHRLLHREQRVVGTQEIADQVPPIVILRRHKAIMVQEVRIRPNPIINGDLETG